MVVGFLARSRDRLLLPHKLGKWKKEPSPTSLCELVQCLLRLGDLEAAWGYARQGVARYKDSDLVREIHRIAGRAHAEQGLQAAQVEVKERPSANAFLRLARCAVLLRDNETALQAIEECVRRYPMSAAAHAALAELLEQRWLRDLASADGRAVVNHLRKAWRLDGADATRPLRLATFLARIGAQRTALAVLQELIELDDQNHDALALRESLMKSVAADVESGKIDPELDEDIDLFLRQIEEQGRVVGDPSDTARVARESDRLRVFLPALRQKTSCERALVLEPKGAAFDENGALGVNPLTNLAANLVRSANLATRRADLGALVSASLETAGGTLLVQRAQRCCVAMLVDDPEGLATGRAALKSLVQGRLTQNERAPA